MPLNEEGLISLYPLFSKLLPSLKKVTVSANGNWINEVNVLYRGSLASFLLVSIWEGEFSIAAKLVERGADPNFGKQSALTECLRMGRGHTKIPMETRLMLLLKLLEFGADPQTKSLPFYGSSDAVSPMEIAVSKGQLEAVEILLKNGASLRVVKIFAVILRTKWAPGVSGLGP